MTCFNKIDRRGVYKRSLVVSINIEILYIVKNVHCTITIISRNPISFTLVCIKNRMTFCKLIQDSFFTLISNMKTVFLNQVNFYFYSTFKNLQR